MFFRYHEIVPRRQHAGPGPAASDVPEPSLAERARTLTAIGLMGTLSTHSRKFPGFPFGSMMPFAADALGRPVFFISSMAMHTQNLHQDPRASLFIAQPDAAGDPLGSARLTLLGTACPSTPAEVRDLYLARHQNARFWQDYEDFAYYRLEVEGAYFIGGFGVMGWVSAPDYAEAVPDPLAPVASEIIQHMNADHGPAMCRIAAHDSGETPEEATMTAVDRLGFHLRLRSGEHVYGRRIAFPREVRNKTEARTALIEMARSALDKDVE